MTIRLTHQSEGKWVMAYRVGTQVMVTQVDSNDPPGWSERAEKRYKGRTGVVSLLRTGDVGETAASPLHIVVFGRGGQDVFWTEELRRVCKRTG